MWADSSSERTKFVNKRQVDSSRILIPGSVTSALLNDFNSTSTPDVSNIPSATPFNLNADELIAAFTNFLQFDVGAGGASAETIRTYWCEVRYYLLWCQTNQLQPLIVTRDQIKIYRHHLVSKKYKPTTISLKLVAISRMYDAAMEYGLLISNPVWGVKPPKQRSDPAERITYLTATEAQAFLQAPLNKPPSLKTLRDQLLLGIMTLEGARTMEVHRANIKDIVRGVMGVGITVTSKQQQRIVPLIPELVDLLDRYLLSRKKAGYRTHYSTVFWHYQNWCKDGSLERIETQLHGKVREQAKKNRNGRP